MNTVQWFEQLGSVDFLDFGLDLTLKATILLGVAALATQILVRASAAMRHRVWCLAFASVLVLPALMVLVPPLHIAMIPRSLQWSQVSVDVDQTDVDPLASSFVELGNNDTADRAPVNDPSLGIAKTSSEHDVSVPIALLWVVGFVGSLVPILNGLIRTRSLSRDAARIKETDWLQLAEYIRGKLRLRRHVQLLVTDRDVVPITWGVLHPTVLLPASCKDWHQARRRSVLLHEFAHIGRLDLPLQLMARFACALYWFHPLAWYALHRLRVEREQACDDCVVIAGEQASDYAMELVRIAETHCAERSALGVAMARTPHLEGRLRALFDKTRSHKELTRPISQLLLFVVCMTAVTLAAIQPVGKTVHAREADTSTTLSGADDSSAHSTSNSADVDSATADAVPDNRDSGLVTNDQKPSKTATAIQQLEKRGIKIQQQDGQIVSVYGEKLRDGDLRDIAQLNWTATRAGAGSTASNEIMPSIIIYQAQVTDAGLDALKNIPQLRTLFLYPAPSITNDGLRKLKVLTKLEQLWICGSKMDNTGVKYLNELASLTGLYLIDSKSLTSIDGLELPRLVQLAISGTKITDDSLQGLTKQFPKIQELSVRNTAISDATLDVIAKHDGWTSLNVAGTQITDRGASNFAKLSKLRVLHFFNTELTDAALVHVRNLANLRQLGMNNTKITDAGLAHIGGLKNLIYAGLGDTAITDAGLEHVRNLLNLKQLRINNTSVTDQGVEKLRLVLPNCKINYGVPSDGGRPSRVTGSRGVDDKKSDLQQDVRRGGMRDLKQADVLGAWRLRFKIANTEVKPTLTISKDGGKLIGSLVSFGNEQEAKHINVGANQMTFLILSKDPNGNNLPVIYTLSIRGDTMTGSLVGYRGDQREEVKVQGERLNSD